MQFRENLADRQAAEAVRARIDWKYLLGLALTDPGFDFSVLSEFRDRLLASSAEELVLEKLLERCRAMGWLKARGAQRTDSTHVLAAIRVLNRLELVAETLRAALNAVATALGIELRDASVRAEGDLDFRGTLGVAKDAPVGFQAIRLQFDLDTDASAEQLATLLRLTERYCVVYQSLAHTPALTVTHKTAATS